MEQGKEKKHSLMNSDVRFQCFKTPAAASKRALYYLKTIQSYCSSSHYSRRNKKKQNSVSMLGIATPSISKNI